MKRNHRGKATLDDLPHDENAYHPDLTEVQPVAVEKNGLAC